MPRHWRRFFRRSDWDRERSAEIESYIQIETDENVARGMAPGDARDAARRKFGNPTLVREEIYRMNTVAFLDTLARDARYTLRALRHNPAFTVVALLTLAIGIGANTAVFSVVNSVLLNPLRYPKAEQLVAIRQEAPGAAGLASFSKGLPLSTSMYFTYTEQNRSFQAMGVWVTNTANVTGLAEPEQARVVTVSDGLLQALGVPPAAGRWLSPADQVPRGPERVMLSYGYWQRHFGGAPSAIGRNLTVDSRPREIIGVMPRGFRVADAEFDLIAPFQFDRDRSILAGFGLFRLARDRAVEARGEPGAGQCGPGPPDPGLDGLMDQRSRDKRHGLRDLENHPRASPAPAGGGGRRERRLVDRDGHDRVGHARRLCERHQLIAGAGRRPAA
jgi:hypothetical protein